MTKARLPLSFADAVTQIAGRIGWDAAAVAVGRRVRLVRLWSEPDKAACPTMAQALALDAAFAASGGDGAPLLEAYQHQVGVVAEKVAACHRELADSIAAAAREYGEALSASVLIGPGSSPHDVHRAIADTKDAGSALVRLKRCLTRFLPNGAGPVAGNDGGAR